MENELKTWDEKDIEPCCHTPFYGVKLPTGQTYYTCICRDTQIEKLTQNMNELKTFLEEEKKRYYEEPVRKLHLREENADGSFSEQAYMYNWIYDHDTRLVNKVLEMVGKEVSNIKIAEDFNGDNENGEMIFREKVETLINNLTI